MISKECFTSQWIEEISAKLEYNDKSLIEKGVLEIEKYPKDNPEVVLTMEISDTLPTKLRKLKNVIPEAYYYWAKIDQLF